MEDELSRLHRKFSQRVPPVFSDGTEPKRVRPKVVTSSVVCRFCHKPGALRGYKNYRNAVKCPTCHAYYFL